MNDQRNRDDDFEERLLDQLQEVVAERATAAGNSGAPAGGTPPAWRRRGPRLALGGAVALAALAAALIVSAGGDNAPAAYAVEPQPGGGTRIEIYSLDDFEGVEEALAEAGIASQVNFLPPGMVCREPHYQPSMGLLRTLQDHQPQPQPWAGSNYESTDGPLVISIGTYQQRKKMDEDIHEAVRTDNYNAAEWPSFVVDPDGFRPDQTLIMTSAPTPESYEQPLPPGAFQAGVHYIPSGVPIDTVGQIRVAEGEVGPCEPVAAGDGVPPMDGLAPIRAPEGGWDFTQHPYAGWGFGFGLKAPSE